MAWSNSQRGPAIAARHHAPCEVLHPLSIAMFNECVKTMDRLRYAMMSRLVYCVTSVTTADAPREPVSSQRPPPQRSRAFRFFF
jgi:hypothetical protein